MEKLLGAIISGFLHSAMGVLLLDRLGGILISAEGYDFLLSTPSYDMEQCRGKRITGYAVSGANPEGFTLTLQFTEGECRFTLIETAENISSYPTFALTEFSI